jgi:hypothetical protein
MSLADVRGATQKAFVLARIGMTVPVTVVNVVVSRDDDIR